MSTKSKRDIESRNLRTRPSHFKLLLDRAGVTPEVIAWSYMGKGTEEEPYIVDFLEDDPKNPMKFPQWKKWSITVVEALAVLAVAFCSSAFSGGIGEVIREFQISQIVAILGVSLFVTGFALGPLLWAPLSELFGRQIMFSVTYMALTAFNAGAAAAPNIQALLVLRFLAGTFGSSPLTNAGGVIADLFVASERGMASAAFAMAPFLGPSIGPIAGGFLGQVSWRWVEGLMACFSGLLWIVGSLYVPETYAPVILRRRAAKLSELTGKAYVSKLDAGKPKKTVSQEFKVALTRPWVLLFTEPIVLLTSLYMAIVYGTLYMMFAAFPIVFQQQRGWSPGIGGLAFLGVAVGMLFAVSYSMYDNKRYAKILEARGGTALPEARLPTGMIGSVLLPIGLFWFAWTNGTNIHWIVPITASGFFGAGLVLVFLSFINYLIDSYSIYAASVLAANSVLRSLFGAAFPLFTTNMYRNLGIHWASSVPAFLALACLPFPFLFYKYGESIRLRCKFAAEAADALLKMRTKVADDSPAISEGRHIPRDDPAGLFSDTSTVTTTQTGEAESSALAGNKEKR
ncbi:major facilitator superfamily transporter [Xylariales sp. AK1849]|nr:major facilitator superfamily transporter [Xylariales sp. AK1849]